MFKIKTIVEFFDECQIENVIASLRYTPEKIIFVGYNNLMTKRRRAALGRFFELRGYDVNTEYEIIDRYDYQGIIDKLNYIIDSNDDCYFDLTGGKELALTAMGVVSAARRIPMIQFNVRSGQYVKLSEQGELPDARIPFLSIPEMIALNGGAVIRNEPEDFKWSFDDEFLMDIENMWTVCKRNCGLWNRQSMVLKSFEQYGHIDDELVVRVNLTHMETVKQDTLMERGIISHLTDMGLIKDLCESGGLLTFAYKNEQIHRALTKAGNIFELYAYTLLREIEATNPGYYDDMDIGVYLDWDGQLHDENDSEIETKNEVDMIVMRDAIPVFISCKNGEVKKEALYELETVARHFGGEYAKMVLLTTYITNDHQSRKYLLQRAKDMNIDVIENTDSMSRDKLIQTLKKRIK